VKFVTRKAVCIVGAAALSLSFAAALTQSASARTGGHPSASPATKHNIQHLCSKPKRPDIMACFALRRVDSLHQKVGAGILPSGYGPSDIVSAYKLNTSAGGGQTVAIVDAYDDPNAESDLATYRSTYGLPACTTANGCFKKVNQNGVQGSYPPADQGWAGEISLDVDMVSAACPNCKILLVEATSASIANLGISVNRAVTMGAKFVSNSYGGGESSGETSWDTSYYRHNGVAVTASTGDNGYGVSYPASSPYVTAVGGTHLTRDGSSRGWTESAWSGAGSGCSAYEAKPSYQSSVNTGCARRAVADVSAVADPATGVAVYQTYGGSGWAVYGGTSASSPIIASVYALAGTPGAADNPASYPYAHPGNLFDVTTGSNGSCSPTQLCHAGAGWDGPTGLGTPNGSAAFAAGGGSGTVTVNNPGNQTTTVGTAVNLQLSATGGTPPYTWSATGLPPGLSIGSSTGKITGTPTTAGSYTVTATAKDVNQVSGSATFNWTINSGGGGCSGQLLGNPGFETGSAAPWSATAGVISSNGSGQTAHTGSWFAWLDGYGQSHTDTLSQTITIPAGCGASLSYYLKITTSESGSTQYDKLSVKIGSTVVASYSNVDATGAYVPHSVNLGAYAGQTVTLTYTGTEDSSLQTSFVLDDTAITLS
jgi:hypothetical protein